jgi:diguanylate cyclase (GGDEF)-like protein
MKALSPLTGLPGNIRIQEEIQRKVDDEIPFAVLYCDLDNFKAYNDHYGFARGDRVIVAAARILQEIVEDMAKVEGFVGHVGGDDFVVVVSPDVAEQAAALMCQRFDREVRHFYDREDLERGWVEVEDRQGVLQRFGLIAISIGVASSARRKFSHYGEAVDVATEMKQFAKRQPGSSFAVDRRTM